ncbi:MAG TPA: NAD(P)-dependent oxidoreductase [Mucilaginibacter sp.]|jgi:D-lactate dehydrogenase|nr:NAD(P)-dependent oxidoreductase [Mucilaginibacter sp.]
MKAVAYSVKPFEKEFLAKANQKKHDITLISNDLNPETAVYAAGKDVVIVLNDDVDAAQVKRLANFGVKYIAARSIGVSQIDSAAAANHHIKIADAPFYPPQSIAELAVGLALALGRNIATAKEKSARFDFRNEDLLGFNFCGKTVGIIGLGKIGQAVANIFAGMGCNIIAYDPAFPADAGNVTEVDLETLFLLSDVISLHVPLTADSNHFINRKAFEQMKKGVMLINTSNGELINTKDAVIALENGKLGFLGIDVYEHEKGLFFEDHENDKEKDPLLARLIDYPNVLVTPHQAYLTRESIQSIAYQIINHLDQWQVEQRNESALINAKNTDPEKLKEPSKQISHAN